MPNRARANEAQAERLFVLEIDPDFTPRALALDPKVDARFASCTIGCSLLATAGVESVGRKEGRGGRRGERGEDDSRRGWIERGEGVSQPRGGADNVQSSVEARPVSVQCSRTTLERSAACGRQW